MRQTLPPPCQRISPVPQPLRAPSGGWYDVERDGEIAVSGNDLIAYGVPSGPEIGFVLGRLAAMVTEEKTLNEREALLELVDEVRTEFRYPPQPRFRITKHAVERYIERINAESRPSDAYHEIVALVENAPFTRSAPSWTLLNDRDKICGGYLEVADGVCFAMQDGVIRTVLTRELSESEPPGEDPFPSCGKMRPDPVWPDRRYVANSTGEIECRTILDGELIIAPGRSRFVAWKCMRHIFNQRGLRIRFETGQEEYRLRAHLPSQRILP